MTDNSASNKRIAKNTLFLYVRMFFVLVVALYTSRVTLNVLGVEDFGTYNVVCGFVAMFAFLNTAMANAIQRFYSFEMGKNGGTNFSKVYTSAVITQVVIVAGVLIFAETAGLWYLNTEMVIPAGRNAAAMIIYQFAVISLILVVLQVPYSSAIIAHEKMDFYAIVSIIDVFIKLAFVIILQYIPSDKLITYGAFNLAITVITFSLYYFYSKKKFQYLNLENKIDWINVKSILTFSGWNVCGSFAYMVQNQGLNLLLNVFFGPVVNAARGISFQVMSAIQGFSGNIFMAIRPQVIESYAAGNYKRTTLLIFTTSKLTFFLFLLFALPLSLEIDVILHMWLGDAVPEYTSVFTVLVLVNMLLSNLNTPLSQVVHATGNMKLYQVVTSIIVCSVLPISYALLKLGYNAVSVFVCTIAVTIVNQIVCLFVLKRIYQYSIREYATKVIIPCFSVLILSMIIPFAIRFHFEESLYRFLLIMFTGVLSVIVTSYYLGISSNERNQIKAMVFKKIKK